MNIFNIITLFGGLALFLYGMRIMGDGLKESSTDVLKRAMEKITNNPFKSFLLGVGVTAVIQSSTATIVLTSGLVGAGIISLHQSVGIILGANVGTTITGQIIRLLDVDAGGSSLLTVFKPSTLAPVAVIIGIILIMSAKKQRTQTIGKICMGFGILFTGLLGMTDAVEPLSSIPVFQQMVVTFSKTPVLGYLCGAAVAFLLQSASASIGILQALSMTGAFTFNSMYSIIVGIYIGDAVTTAIVCSIGSKADAKRTGMVQLIFNICQTIIILVALSVLHKTGLLDGIWNSAANPGIIANTNTIFKLACAVILLPFCGLFERTAIRIIPDDPKIGISIERELGLLDEKLFASPALALAAAKEVITSMAKISQEAVLNAIRVLQKYDRMAVEVIRENEDNLDALADHVDNYLIKLSAYIPKGPNNDVLNYYIQCFGEFERIGDYAVNLTENADDLLERGAEFSQHAKEELSICSLAIKEIIGYTYIAFSKDDVSFARKIEPIEEVVDDLVVTLRNHHIKRLKDGKCNIYAGLEFLDVLVNIERIADQCSNIGVYNIGTYGGIEDFNHHDYIRDLHKGTDPQFNKDYRECRDKYFSEMKKLDDGAYK